MANTHRYEARIAERSVNLLGLPGGAVVDVQDSFRSPKAHILKSTRYHAWSRKCTRALTFENFEFWSFQPATLATSCFSRAVFGKGKADMSDLEGENPGIPHSGLTWSPHGASGDVTVRFTLFAPRKECGHSVWVTGGAAALGSWSSSGIHIHTVIHTHTHTHTCAYVCVCLCVRVRVCVCVCV
jgi:hypothetical protein